MEEVVEEVDLKKHMVSKETHITLTINTNLITIIDHNSNLLTLILHLVGKCNLLNKDILSHNLILILL